MDDDYDVPRWQDYATEAWSPALLAEATASTTPSHTAFLTRDLETLWINAYPAIRLITLTYPPVPLPDYDKGEQVRYIREVPVGRDADIGECFRSLVCQSMDGGWVRRAHGVWVGEPWDSPSTLDQPPSF
jgi:hypothetical protein